jgi:hypothetical protein
MSQGNCFFIQVGDNKEDNNKDGEVNSKEDNNKDGEVNSKVDSNKDGEDSNKVATMDITVIISSTDLATDGEVEIITNKCRDITKLTTQVDGTISMIRDFSNKFSKSSRSTTRTTVVS